MHVYIKSLMLSVFTVQYLVIIQSDKKNLSRLVLTAQINATRLTECILL